MGVTRETLYAEVWAEPMTKVAARYGVSSNFLARVCERLNVPHPSRGYWAQLKVNKATERPALPEARPGNELEWNRDGMAQRVPLSAPAAPAEEPEAAPPPIARRPGRHLLVDMAQSHLEGAPEVGDGYLKPAKRMLPDLVITGSARRHALAVANELFQTLEARGHPVKLAPLGHGIHRMDLHERGLPQVPRTYPRLWQPDRPTVVFIGTVAIGLTLYETTEEVDVTWVDGKWVRASAQPAQRRHARVVAVTHKHPLPTGRLGLSAYSPYGPGASWKQAWTESPSIRLSEQIPEIVKVLKRAARTIANLVEEEKLRAEAERKRWEEERLKWQQQEAERRRAQALKDSRAELLSIIEAWALGRRVDAFFEDAEQHVALLPPSEQTAAVERIHRARDFFAEEDALALLRRWRRPEDY